MTGGGWGARAVVYARVSREETVGICQSLTGWLTIYGTPLAPSSLGCSFWTPSQLFDPLARRVL